MDQTPIRILLIEDEPECALLMESFLKVASRTAFAYTLERGETLAQGLALLREGEFDVVLLDLVLPDSRGLATLREVKAHGRGVTIVVLTGLRDEDLGRRAIEEGAQDFLCKGDFNSEMLRHVIRFAYDRGRLLHGFEHILECTPDGVVVVGDDGLTRYASPSAAILFNKSLRDLVGKPFGWPVGPEKPAEITLEAEGGGRRVAEMAAARIEWRGETSWLVSVRDVTVLKMIEAARAGQEERRLQEAAKERFLQSVAHDLRSPMNVICAMVERCGELLPAASEAEERLLLAGRSALKRMLKLVEGLLSLWQLESGGMAVCRSSLDLASVAERVLEEARAAHPGKDINAEFEEGLGPVFADEDMVARLLSNLLDNACRYGRRVVTVRCRAEGPEQVCLSVTDDGPGVAEARLGAIFDRFSQGDRFMDESGYKGTGLGLALCREIARLNDGSIDVESELGKGATFSVRLPACLRRVELR
ncbi:MAG: hybrid sensor histidine kinase/response regulator [Elusimicrobia bacterium]|nr:hybrid sensor histidine kinase/response regulator [Elusimicrobiota bacterium]